MRSKTLVSGILLLFIVLLTIVTLDVALTPKPERVIKVLVTSDVHGRIFEERSSGAIGYAKLQGYASYLLPLHFPDRRGNKQFWGKGMGGPERLLP